jgi:hypothetical protein
MGVVLSEHKATEGRPEKVLPPLPCRYGASLPATPLLQMFVAAGDPGAGHPAAGDPGAGHSVELQNTRSSFGIAWPGVPVPLTFPWRPGGRRFRRPWRALACCGCCWRLCRQYYSWPVIHCGREWRFSNDTRASGSLPCNRKFGARSIADGVGWRSQAETP